jgi:hypothetical protein
MNTGIVLVDVAVKDLSGAALDWAVAQVAPQCQGLKWEWQGGYYMAGKAPETGDTCVFICGSGVITATRLARDLEAPRYNPSSSWAQCGPLIDKYKACFAAYDYGYLCRLAHNDLHHGQGKGPDHLTAACRAIVAAILGDIVKVPACLVMP